MPFACGNAWPVRRSVPWYGRGGVEAAAEVDLAEGVEVAPAFHQRVDVLVVDVERLGLDERIVVATAGVGRVDMVEVEVEVEVEVGAPVDVF